VPQKLIIIRHGETDYNLNHRFQGWLPVPLNNTGHTQARILAQRLATETIDVIFTSDLSRAIQTARPLARAKNIKLHHTQNLRERHMGVLQDLNHDRIGPKHQAIFDRLKTNQDPDWAIPGGESWNQVIGRVSKLIDLLHRRYTGQSVALVTHGGTKRALLHHLGLAPFAQSISIPNTSVTILKKNPTLSYRVVTSTTISRPPISRSGPSIHFPK